MNAGQSPSAPFPLASTQREIWFDQVLHGDVPLYNIGGRVDLRGRLDPALFRRAANLLARQHDTLRLALSGARDEDGVPLQFFAGSLQVEVPLWDFSGEADPEAAASAWMRGRFEEPFDLSHGPLFRYDLLKLAEERWVWLLQYHHLITDGFGVALLNRSLAAIYSALAAGREPDLHAPSYRDYVEDDRAYAESAKFEQQRAFWRAEHPAPPAPLLEPWHRARFAGGLAGSGCQSAYLPRELYARLDALAKTQGATLFHLLLGALYAYFTGTGQREDFAVGLPVLNRANARLKETAGLFTGVSPVRFDFGREVQFSELLGQIGAKLKAVYRHQRFPLSEIARAAGAERGRSRLFEVTLSYESHDYDAAFGGIDSHFTALLHTWEQTPLTLFVRDFHEQADVRLDLVHNLAYFDAGEARALLGRLVHLLETLADGLDRPVRALPLMPPAEWNQVLYGWNATAADYPKDVCVHELFEQQADQTPEAVALVFEDERLSYAELNAKANRLARHLKTLGAGPDRLVAICLERSFAMVEALLATLKAGSAYVPLDPAYPPDRLAFMLQDSAPAALVVHGATREAVAGLGAACPLADLDADAGQWAALADGNLPRAEGGAEPGNLAYVIYTSGSTGKPKGVNNSAL